MHIYVPDHMNIWTVRVQSGPYTYTRQYDPTIRVQSDRITIRVWSSMR